MQRTATQEATSSTSDISSWAGSACHNKTNQARAKHMHDMWFKVGRMRTFSVLPIIPACCSSGTTCSTLATASFAGAWSISKNYTNPDVFPHFNRKKVPKCCKVGDTPAYLTSNHHDEETFELLPHSEEGHLAGCCQPQVELQSRFETFRNKISNLLRTDAKNSNSGSNVFNI